MVPIEIARWKHSEELTRSIKVEKVLQDYLLGSGPEVKYLTYITYVRTYVRKEQNLDLILSDAAYKS